MWLYFTVLHHIPWIILNHFVILTVIISCRHKPWGKNNNNNNCISNEWIYFDMSIFAEAAISFWVVIMHNLNRSSTPLRLFFCKAGCKQKVDSSTGLERQFPLSHPTVWENGQDIWMISVKSHLYLFTSVIHVCMSVCMWLQSQTFTLELYQETLALHILLLFIPKWIQLKVF